MNILFLCHRIPYPPNKGDKIRSFNEIKHLSRNHRIFLACLIDSSEDVKYIDELKKYCHAVDYDVIHPRWKKIRSLPALFCRRPMSVPYFYSRHLQNAVDKRLSEHDVDVIFAFSSPMAEYVMKSRGGLKKEARLIMDFVDVDSDKWRMYAEHANLFYSFIYRKEWKSLMRYEKKIGELFDLSLFVSHNEVSLYKSFAPDAQAMSIPNGVDVDYFADLNNVTREESGNHVIIFTGAMDYFPNEDAVLYFAGEMWPELKKKLPRAVFYVVGGNPSKRVKALSEGESGIIVTGHVPDVRTYLQKADLFVAPLRMARGIQNKVLEAMAAGVPVVARPEAVQGLPASNGCIRVAGNQDTFIDAIMEILKDSQKRERLIMNAKGYIHTYHNWHKNLECLETLMN